LNGLLASEEVLLVSRGVKEELRDGGELDEGAVLAMAGSDRKASASEALLLNADAVDRG